VWAVAGGALLFDAGTLAGSLALPAAFGRGLGAALLLLALATAVAPLWWRRPVNVRGWTIPPPSPAIAAGQLLIGVVDWIIAAAVLFVLLPAGVPIGFGHFAALFVVAQVAGVASHVPAGLGVFETVMLVALSPHAPSPALLGALLAYRVVYYVLPLALATLLLAADELGQRRERLAALGSVAGRWLSEIAPRVLAVAIFASGALLLFSSAGRRHAGRLDMLRDLLPLPVLEVSHFLASLAGLGLILLASGLQRRLDAAYHLAVALLGAGAVLALLKGFDWEESLLLLALLAVLLPCRGEFHRPASLISERFTLVWGVAVAVVLAASLWIGFFVHKHTDYSHELWWQFSLFGDAPRFLRASVGVVVGALALAVRHLLHAAPLRAVPPDADSLATARAIVAGAPVAAAHLALLGDKSFLLSADRRAFVTYAVAGRSCVAMGDPAGVHLPDGARLPVEPLRRRAGRAHLHPLAGGQRHGARLPHPPRAAAVPAIAPPAGALGAEGAEPPRHAGSAVRRLSRRAHRPHPSRSEEDPAVDRQSARHAAVDAQRTRRPADHRPHHRRRRRPLLERMIAMRADGRLPDAQFVDVAYADLMARPLDTLAARYARLGIDLTATARARMAAHLAARPRGRHGPHRYGLADFGFTATAVDRLYAAYLDRFAIAAER
jgi:hypothetical protein